MARLRWPGRRDEGGEAAETPDNGLRPDGNGTPMAGWTRPAGGGQSQVPAWLQQTAGWAWRLLEWQTGHAGPRPDAPKIVPEWYWRWSAWQTLPFHLRGS